MDGKCLSLLLCEKDIVEFDQQDEWIFSGRNRELGVPKDMYLLAGYSSMSNICKAKDSTTFIERRDSIIPSMTSGEYFPE